MLFHFFLSLSHYMELQLFASNNNRIHNHTQMNIERVKETPKYKKQNRKKLHPTTEWVNQLWGPKLMCTVAFNSCTFIFCYGNAADTCYTRGNLFSSYCLYNCSHIKYGTHALDTQPSGKPINLKLNDYNRKATKTKMP